MNSFKKILLIQTAFIGDAILATAALESLRKTLPQAELHLLVRQGNEALFAEHPYLKKIWIWNKKEQKIKNLFRLIGQVREEKFDWIVNLHRFASSGIITFLAGAKITGGFGKNPFSFLFTYKVKHIIGDGKHEVERNNLLLTAPKSPLSKEKPEISKPKLYPTAKNYEKIKPLQTGEYVCMAPASVWFTKQLPAYKWTRLCDKTTADTTIYLLGAKGDEILCNEIKNNSLHQKIEVLCGKLNLLDSCALMEKAKMNYVNDSGPLHLASSMNAPVTAFFCSTVPAFGFYPLSEESIVAEATPPPPCRPCGLHGYQACPLGHFKCAHDIEI